MLKSIHKTQWRVSNLASILYQQEPNSEVSTLLKSLFLELVKELHITDLILIQANNISLKNPPLISSAVLNYNVTNDNHHKCHKYKMSMSIPVFPKDYNTILYWLTKKISSTFLSSRRKKANFSISLNLPISHLSNVIGLLINHTFSLYYPSRDLKLLASISFCPSDYTGNCNSIQEILSLGSNTRIWTCLWQCKSKSNEDQARNFFLYISNGDASLTLYHPLHLYTANQKEGLVYLVPLVR